LADRLKGRSLLILALSLAIFLSAAITGHWLNAIVGAAGFFLFGDRLIAWFIASKTGADEAEPTQADLDPEFAAVLAGLESSRVVMAAEIERRIRARLPLGLSVGVGIWMLLQLSDAGASLVQLATFSLMGAGAGWAWAAAALAERYRRMYKQEVLTRLAASFGDLVFRPAQDVDLGALKRHWLVGDYDRSRVEDELAGHYHGVPISIVELRLDRDNDKSTTTIFDGLLARVKLPRSLRGTTIVLADEGALGALRDLLRRDGARVRLEDPAFEQQFQVFGTDQIAARALLTPAFMERFMALGARTGFREPLAVAEDYSLTILLPKADATDLFEPPSYDRPAASRAALTRLRDDIAAVLGVANAVLDLDQSVRRRTAPSVASN